MRFSPILVVSLALVICGCAATKECDVSLSQSKAHLWSKSKKMGLDGFDKCLEEANRFADTVNLSVCSWVQTSGSHKGVSKWLSPIADGFGAVATATAPLWNQKPTQTLVVCVGVAVAFGVSCIVSVWLPDDDEYATQAITATSDLQTEYNNRVLKKRSDEKIKQYESVQQRYLMYFKNMDGLMLKAVTSADFQGRTRDSLKSAAEKYSGVISQFETEMANKAGDKSKDDVTEEQTEIGAIIDALSKFKVAIENLQILFPGEATFNKHPAFIDHCWGVESATH